MRRHAGRKPSTSCMSARPGRPRRGARRRIARRAARRPRSSAATSPCARARSARRRRRRSPCARRRRRRRAASRSRSRPPLRSPGDALARVDGAFGQRAPRALRRRLAETQRGAGRRVDLVPVVHLDDLDVVGGTEPRRGISTSASSTLTPTLMFGAKTMGILARVPGELRLLLRRESGGAHDRAGAVPDARPRDGRACPRGG